MNRAICFIALMMGECVFAGWSSGGGELNKDAYNPWFLKNVEEVRYCIKMDEHNFSATRELAVSMIEKAISYWDKEFYYASKPMEHPDAVVGTQKFIPGECDANTDLTFQLGYLTEEQKTEFARQGKRPNQFVGLAVRTDYDLKNLKGKGFIYLSADSGPLAMEGANIADKPWGLGEGGVLHKVLVHELGHVFGIPHLEDDFHYGLMSEDYPERVVHSAFAEIESDLHSIPGFFSAAQPARALVTIGVIDRKPDGDDATTEFFGVPGNSHEVRFERDKNGDVRVTSDPKRFAGKIAVDPNTVVMTAKHLIKIRLNREQEVFPDARSFEPVFGPGLKITSTRGVLTLKNGTKRDVFLTYGQTEDDFRIGGLKDGKIFYSMLKNR